MTHVFWWHCRGCFAHGEERSAATLVDLPAIIQAMQAKHHELSPDCQLPLTGFEVNTVEELK